MKLAFWILLLLLFILLVAVALTNPSATVESLQLGGMQFQRVPVMVIVMVSMVVGVVFTGVWALIEGASIRLANRRLRREIQRLETENNFLRTQHADDTREEPDAPTVPLLERELEPGVDRNGERWRQGQPPSAPVYDAGEPSEVD